jgi:phage terminase small subunit
MRGRKPKPRSLKVLQGTFRKDRDRNEPRPEHIAPSCPRWLPVEAKRKWHQLAPELFRLGLLTRLDSAAFSAFCVIYGRWRAAEEVIAREGMTVTGPGWPAESASMRPHLDPGE